MEDLRELAHVGCRVTVAFQTLCGRKFQNEAVLDGTG